MSLTTSSIVVESLHVYPVKSMGGITAHEIEVQTTGFKHDRQWMVVEAESHVFVSQRDDPQLARFKANIIGSDLCIMHDGVFLVSLAVNRSGGETYPVRVHKNWQLGVDQGNLVALRLSQALGRPVRLVKKAPQVDRWSPDRSDRVEVAFADAFPLMIASVESLSDLNGRLETPVPMNRFRPNIVVRGVRAAFDEDFFDRFRIGSVELQGRTRCTRCPVTQNDHLTGERGAEPMRTLMTYRVFPDSKRPCFGLNVDHLGTGWISINQPVLVDSRQTRDDSASCVAL